MRRSAARSRQVYRLVSASTYYKKKYAGSTLYEVGGNLRVHYGQQDDAEELFSFVPSGEGYALRAVHSGNFAQLPHLRPKPPR